MNSRPDLHELLYVSTLQQGIGAQGVAALTNSARTANKTLKITGVLVFDGERFCQFLEGSMKDVVKLFERICSDPRHIKVDMVHQGPIERRHFQQFSMGYAYVEDVDLIESVAALSGPAARDLFVSLSDRIDFGA